VDRLEVLDVGDHESNVRAQGPGVVDLNVQTSVECAPVGEIRQGVGLCLPRKACEIGEYAGNWASEARREPCRKREGDGRGEQQPSPVRGHSSLDGGNRL